jgi:hypothetical protein
MISVTHADANELLTLTLQSLNKKNFQMIYNKHS